MIQVDGVHRGNQRWTRTSPRARCHHRSTWRSRREKHRDLVEKHLGSALPDDFGKFAALNAALWDGGIFVYVPRGVRIEKPIRVARWITRGRQRGFPAYADRRG